MYFINKLIHSIFSIMNLKIIVHFIFDHIGHFPERLVRVGEVGEEAVQDDGQAAVPHTLLPHLQHSLSSVSQSLSQSGASIRASNEGNQKGREVGVFNQEKALVGPYP